MIPGSKNAGWEEVISILYSILVHYSTIPRADAEPKNEILMFPAHPSCRLYRVYWVKKVPEIRYRGNERAKVILGVPCVLLLWHCQVVFPCMTMSPEVRQRCRWLWFPSINSSIRRTRIHSVPPCSVYSRSSLSASRCLNSHLLTSAHICRSVTLLCSALLTPTPPSSRVVWPFKWWYAANLVIV